ncbi:MAG: D-alanine--D-alanine ligase [Phycisphaerae bacterium]|nr:D-alanine--D-alanine ligase [Phycisphaerae bacterium]|tara:strand:+ start:2183 stop:3100 length:918 start_codon:yes stop_codon:yes gene_type:complete
MNRSDHIRVVVLMGGPDEEHEVSLASGTAVAEALSSVEGIEVDARVIRTVDADELAGMDADVVFPVLHGPWGEGGGIQSELERAGVAFVGSGSQAAAIAMDKIRTKEIAAGLDVPTPVWQVLEPGTRRTLSAPAVLKPPAQGSSIDLCICRTEPQLDEDRARLHRSYDRLLAETCVTGRELTVGVVGDQVLPIIEIVPAHGVYDYEAKYDRDDTEYRLDPELDDDIAERCRTNALTLGRHLGCRDLYRVDFILENRVPWMLEINTMPGFTGHSLLPMAARADGRSMPQLCHDLITMAASRALPSR